MSSALFSVFQKHLNVVFTATLKPNIVPAIFRWNKTWFPHYLHIVLRLFSNYLHSEGQTNALPAYFHGHILISTSSSSYLEIVLDLFSCYFHRKGEINTCPADFYGFVMICFTFIRLAQHLPNKNTKNTERKQNTSGGVLTVCSLWTLHCACISASY